METTGTPDGTAPRGADDDVDDVDDGAEEQVPTGLGSGAASGLGHSQTSEPEPLLEAGTGTRDEDG